MRRETVRGVDRVPHGGSDEASLLDVSANTNPEVPAGAADVYREAFAEARRYPPEPQTTFRDMAAAYVGCDPGQVVPTPGGLAAIRLATTLTVDGGDSALVPAPSFAEYAREVRLQGGVPEFVPESGILEADPEGHALAIVCTPNNPTGRGYAPAALDAFIDRCRAVDTPVLLDEAFLGFTDRPSRAGTEGVIVARSLTKLFGLPGIRMGFAVATGIDHTALEAARRPWNVSAPALALGRYCMDQTDFINRTRERVAAERARMRTVLAEEYAVSPSEAPFLLLDVGDHSVERLLDRAREHGVVLRDATTFRGLSSHVRVAVRLTHENDRVLEVLTDDG